MRAQLRIGFALATLLALSSAVAALADESKPVALIEEMRADLGEIYEAPSYKHTFQIKNTGTADLKVLEVKPGCGCTVAKFDEVIAPGKTGNISLEVEGTKVSGSWSKMASVSTNDPDHPRITISIAGTILYYVDVQPTRVYLRGMFGEPVEKDITIVSNEKAQDFKVLDVSSNIDDKMTYKLIPEAEPGRYTIRVYKNPKLPTMNTWGSLTIKTNSEHSAEKVVQVNVVTRGAIIAQPSTLNFGTVTGTLMPSDESKQQTLTVFKVKGDFKIMDVEFSSDGYEAAWEPIEEGRKYKITVGFRPTAPQKSYVDEMIINTDDPNEPAVRVRLVARGA